MESSCHVLENRLGESPKNCVRAAGAQGVEKKRAANPIISVIAEKKPELRLFSRLMGFCPKFAQNFSSKNNVVKHFDGFVLLIWV